jgi:hypothetical protein
VAILAIAVVTVLCGATNVREIAYQAADLPQDLLALLRGRFDQRAGRYNKSSGWFTDRRRVILCGILRGGGMS